MTWIASAWDYLWEAVRTHPFNFFTLALAGAALIYAHRSAQAARRQAEEAKKMRRVSEEALGVAETSANAASESARSASRNSAPDGIGVRCRKHFRSMY